MSKRVTLTNADIELLVKLLNGVDKGRGFSYVATSQRVDEILAKLYIEDESDV